ncbi:predicted protein [Naegleria gruberi]|uniref:protein-serine/threonine phosphatase n=1 Tax=Naegleria gruberi TaxID=5762 RepID=D2VJP4_NAEGR|nr:uncharacterized protein NAEGRDRAFT_69113 [Naegleria gruberi]EFC42988.1 predicted protein [Naegleria gruberi]|eukprot:XP_002675732.1 predicted protein [Naegleria gruberi strain NEG-M]
MQNESSLPISGDDEQLEYLDEGMIIMEANLEKDVKCSLIKDWSLNENILIGRGQVIGFRENQEDFEKILIGKETILCGVFDGHCGDACARFISSKCLDEISQNIKLLNNNISTNTTINSDNSNQNQILNINEQVLEETFAKLQSDYIQFREEINSTTTTNSSNNNNNTLTPETTALPPENSTSTNREEDIISLECGTTANIILLSSHNPSTIYSINCGDSRAIYFNGTKTIMLSRDHKPNDLDENSRIKKLGGHIDEESGRIDGFLSYSRSFGDLDYQPIVSYSPELKIMERQEKKSGAEFILIATDGLFEGFKSNEECTHYITEFLQSHNYNAENATIVISELIGSMLDYCVNELESMDNVTLQLVMFMHK